MKARQGHTCVNGRSAPQHLARRNNPPLTGHACRRGNTRCQAQTYKPMPGPNVQCATLYGALRQVRTVTLDAYHSVQHSSPGGTKST
jgi:hypothetical protein